jgi:hypothetical protein
MPNFIATESAVNTIHAAENNVNIPTPTKQRNMRNPSQGFINLNGTIENGDITADSLVMKLLME